MNTQLIPLCSIQDNLFNGKTVIFYDASGKLLVPREHAFDKLQADIVPAFAFEVDTDLLVEKLTGWYKQMVYDVRFIFKSKELNRRLSPALSTISKYIAQLRHSSITAPKAGEIIEHISLELMYIKPPQDKPTAFLRWFKINDLVDSYRERYGVEGRDGNPANFLFTYPQLRA